MNPFTTMWNWWTCSQVVLCMHLCVKVPKGCKHQRLYSSSSPTLKHYSSDTIWSSRLNWSANTPHAAQHVKSHTAPCPSFSFSFLPALVFLSGEQKIRFQPPGYHHNSRLICGLKRRRVIHLQVCYYQQIRSHSHSGASQFRRRFWADARDFLRLGSGEE